MQERVHQLALGLLCPLGQDPQELEEHALGKVHRSEVELLFPWVQVQVFPCLLLQVLLVVVLVEIQEERQ